MGEGKGGRGRLKTQNMDFLEWEARAGRGAKNNKKADGKKGRKKESGVLEKICKRGGNVGEDALTYSVIQVPISGGKI